jgi:hypothetical protein
MDRILSGIVTVPGAIGNGSSFASPGVATLGLFLGASAVRPSLLLSRSLPRAQGFLPLPALSSISILQLLGSWYNKDEEKGGPRSHGFFAESHPGGQLSQNYVKIKSTRTVK